MSGAVQLGNLLNITADLNYYTMQLNQVSAQYEANSKVYSEQTAYEEDFWEAFDDAQDYDKECKVNGRVYKNKNEVLSDAAAETYAHAKVSKYDEALSLELAELDIEYDQQKTMLEAMVTLKQAEKESCKQSTATSLQDTHLLQS